MPDLGGKKIPYGSGPRKAGGKRSPQVRKASSKNAGAVRRATSRTPSAGGSAY